MNTDIRDDILEHQTNTPLEGLIGVAVKHPWYGKSKVSSICSNCQRVTVEFDDTATPYKKTSMSYWEKIQAGKFPSNSWNAGSDTC